MDLQSYIGLNIETRETADTLVVRWLASRLGVVLFLFVTLLFQFVGLLILTSMAWEGFSYAALLIGLVWTAGTTFLQTLGIRGAGSMTLTVDKVDRKVTVREYLSARYFRFEDITQVLLCVWCSRGDWKTELRFRSASGGRIRMRTMGVEDTCATALGGSLPVVERIARAIGREVVFVEVSGWTLAEETPIQYQR
jgi:hypothetical protein